MNNLKGAIIEDEVPAARLLHSMLRRWRPAWEVMVLPGSVEEAVQWFAENPHPDLLFLDVELPDTLGLNLLSEIREDILWDMKVVFYTSYDKYLLQALRESAFDFLLKPF